MVHAHGRSGGRGNPVLRLLLINSLFGGALGIAFAVALVLLNTQGLGQLLLGSDSGVVAFALLASGFMVTFGSVAAGTAIMQIGQEGADRGGPRGPSVGTLVPIVLRVRNAPSGRRDLK